MGKRKNRWKKERRRLDGLTKCLSDFEIQTWEATKFYQLQKGVKLFNNNTLNNMVIFDSNILASYYNMPSNSMLLQKMAQKCNIGIETMPSTAFAIKDTSKKQQNSYTSTANFIKRHFRALCEIPASGQISVLILKIKGKEKRVAIPVFTNTVQILCTNNMSSQTWENHTKLLILCLGLIFSGFTVKYCSYSLKNMFEKLGENTKQYKLKLIEMKQQQQMELANYGFGLF